MAKSIDENFCDFMTRLIGLINISSSFSYCDNPIKSIKVDIPTYRHIQCFSAMDEYKHSIQADVVKGKVEIRIFGVLIELGE